MVQPLLVNETSDGSTATATATAKGRQVLTQIEAHRTPLVRFNDVGDSIRLRDSFRRVTFSADAGMFTA